MKIVVTGFNPFGSFHVNSSEVLVRMLETSEVSKTETIVTAVLKTEFDSAGDEISRLVRTIQPDAVFCTGMSDHDHCLRFEQVARNWNSCPDPDNAGNLRTGEPVIKNGPTCYRATLPYHAFRAALEREGIHSLLSEDAGGYVCNHVFYRACHEISQRQLKTRCGFVHLPSIKNNMDQTGQPLDMIAHAITICLRSLM